MIRDTRDTDRPYPVSCYPICIYFPYLYPVSVSLYPVVAIGPPRRIPSPAPFPSPVSHIIPFPIMPFPVFHQLSAHYIPRHRLIAVLFRTLAIAAACGLSVHILYAWPHRATLACVFGTPLAMMPRIHCASLRSNCVPPSLPTGRVACVRAPAPWTR